MAKSKSTARWLVNEEAARRASTEMRARHKGVKKVTMSPADGALRREWMDLYIGFGGPAEEIGRSSVRIAKFEFWSPLVDATDKAFFDRFPDRRGRSNTNSEADGPYRKAWFDIYVSLGGRVVRVGNSGIRIPAELEEDAPNFLDM